MIYCIVAIEKSQGIGFNGAMPWPRLKGDMQWFREMTTDNIVVMGANTWNSLVKPLPKRMNVIISSRLHPKAGFTYNDPVFALADLSERFKSTDIYVIGGQALYDSVMDKIDVFYITEIDASYTCDKFFNMNYVKETCKNVSEVLHFDSEGDIPAYTIREYTK